MPDETPSLSQHHHALSTTVWLARLGLSRYVTNFQSHATVADLACAVFPENTDISAAERTLRQQYGIVALGARKKISASLRQWAPAVLFSQPPPSSNTRNLSKLLTVPKSKGQLLFRTISGAPPKVQPEVQEKKRARTNVKSLLKPSKLVKRAHTVTMPALNSNPMASPSANRTSSEINETIDLTTEDHGNMQKSQKPLWPIFQKGYVAPATPSKRARANSSLSSTSKSGQRLFKSSKSEKSITKKGGAWQNGDGGGGSGGRRYHLTCHRVPGTGFVVDSFRVSKEYNNATQHLLTHMHSDHYGNLTKKSLPDGMKVLCSNTTAALAKKILGLSSQHLWILPMDEPIDVPCTSAPGHGATIWLYDANHCPGAVLFLFRVWSSSEWILHSGDCRFDMERFNKHSQLKSIVEQRKLGTLYLDTTYAGEKHDFPLQSTVLENVFQAVSVENQRTSGRAMFFCGSYTIGKERVVMAVLEALGDGVRVFAESRKRGILRASSLGADFEDRLTDKAREARVFVVPMGKLSPDGVREFVKRNGIDDSVLGRALVVCVRPTGWSYKPGAKAVRRSYRGADNAVVLNVAYSEHSSLGELRSFVQWARPRRIVPTVGFHTQEERDRLFKLLGHQQ